MGGCQQHHHPSSIIVIIIIVIIGECLTVVVLFCFSLALSLLYIYMYHLGPEEPTPLGICTCLPELGLYIYIYICFFCVVFESIQSCAVLENIGLPFLTNISVQDLALIQNHSQSHLSYKHFGSRSCSDTEPFIVASCMPLRKTQVNSTGTHECR